MNLAVIGLGKLGLPLALLQSKNHNVVGIDLNKKIVDMVNRGIPPIWEPEVPGRLTRALADGTFVATTDMGQVEGTEISLIIVPTPSSDDGSFSSKYVLDAIMGIGQAIRNQDKRHVVVVCSTVMPGQCEGPIREMLEKESGKTVGDSVGLVYSPEFIALGSVIEDMLNPDVTLIGSSDPVSSGTYAAICPQGVPVHYMSLTSAELAKISLNSYVTMKISFANTLGEICEHLPGANAQDVSKAIGADSRVGSAYIRPGGPYGGPCFPRDNRAFVSLGTSLGVDTPLAIATDKVNRRQIGRVLEHVTKHDRKRVGILGFTYKQRTPIVEESFGINLAKQLLFEGYEVVAYDPMLKRKPEEAPEELDWVMNPESCFGNNTVTVVTLPEREISELFPKILSDGGRINSVVIDCWNSLPMGPWDDTHIVRLG